MYLWRTQNHLISSLWITNPLEENKKDKSVIGQSYCAITIKTKLYSSKGMVLRTRHISAIKKTIKVVKWYLKTRILNTLKNILRLKNSILTSKLYNFLGKSKFFTPNFFDNFSREIKTAKKFKTAAFSRVFTQNNSIIFLGKSKLNFWTKNEDFLQCGY